MGMDYAVTVTRDKREKAGDAGWVVRVQAIDAETMERIWNSLKELTELHAMQVFAAGRMKLDIVPIRLHKTNRIGLHSNILTLIT